MNEPENLNFQKNYFYKMKLSSCNIFTCDECRNIMSVDSVSGIVEEPFKQQTKKEYLKRMKK